MEPELQKSMGCLEEKLKIPFVPEMVKARHQFPFSPFHFPKN
jgi:hypothetical protein